MKENRKYLQFQLETSRDRPDYFHIEKYLSDGYCSGNSTCSLSASFIRTKASLHF